MLDLRLPIGAFFVILGGLLVATPSAGAAMTDAPVNLYTGACSLLFGAAMLALHFRSKVKPS